MKNNKGFTLVELLAVVMILGILLAFVTLSYTGYLQRGKDKSFEINVNSFEDAAQAALQDCATGMSNGFCSSHPGIPEAGETITINLTELVNYNYIDRIMNPNNTTEQCTGTVQVKRKTVNASVDNSNFDLCVKSCLQCGTKSSKGCSTNPSCW